MTFGAQFTPSGSDVLVGVEKVPQFIAKITGAEILAANPSMNNVQHSVHYIDLQPFIPFDEGDSYIFFADIPVGHSFGLVGVGDKAVDLFNNVEAEGKLLGFFCYPEVSAITLYAFRMSKPVQSADYGLNLYDAAGALKFTSEGKPLYIKNILRCATKGVNAFNSGNQTYPRVTTRANYTLPDLSGLQKPCLFLPIITCRAQEQFWRDKYRDWAGVVAYFKRTSVDNLAFRSCYQEYSSQILSLYGSFIYNIENSSGSESGDGFYSSSGYDMFEGAANLYQPIVNKDTTVLIIDGAEYD